MIRFIFLLVVFISILGCKKGNDTNTSVVPEVQVPSPPLPIKLLNSNYILGNKAKETKDTFVLQFNKPVSLKSLKFKREFCLPDLQYKIDNDGSRVKFYNFLCGRLGGEYPFEYTVTDYNNQTLTDSVNFKLYSGKLVAEGEITNYYISDDNKYCWVSTVAPDQLVCFKLTDGTIEKSYKLNFTPGKVVFNPYNNRFYITRVNWDNVFPNTIHVMDPSTGNVEKAIPVLPDKYDHPESQQVFVSDIEFGKNGYGTILLRANGTTAERWKVIDSRLNDTIYSHPQWVAAYTGSTSDYYLIRFNICYANYDKSKLLMHEQSGAQGVGIIDCNSHEIVEYVPPVRNTSNSFITPNKKGDKIYFANLLDQFIISGNKPVGYMTPVNLMYSTNFGDFSYRDQDEDYIYLVHHNTFNIIDQKNGVWLFACNIDPNLTTLSSTTDGKFIVARNTNYLQLFAPEMFDKSF